MIRAIIFDLDGVLVSTDDMHYEAWNTIAKEEGIYFDRAINNQLRGISRAESLELILKRSNRAYTPEEKVELAERKNDIYKSLLEKLKPADLLPGAIGAIQTLKNNGIKVALGSSSKNAMYILERLNINSIFDAISDGNIITRSKPDPEVFLRAAELLMVPAWECGVVEDAFAGIEAAKAAGMTAFAVGNAVKCAGTDYILRSLEQLPDLVIGAGKD